MNIAEVWNTCIGVMWTGEYVDGLEKLLKSQNIRSLLDCGGGTGFPSIALKKRGWEVSYVDINPIMMASFTEALKKQHLSIPMYRCEWYQLSKKIESQFDAVICRGNSLIYVDSWGRGPITKHTKDHLKQSLQEFYRRLNPGGIAYIDLMREEEFQPPDFPMVEKFQERMVNGKTINMAWDVLHDLEKKVRTVKITLDIDGKQDVCTLYSVLLRHHELVNLLLEVGFKRVEKTAIEGEMNYAVFVAYK